MLFFNFSDRIFAGDSGIPQECHKNSDRKKKVNSANISLDDVMEFSIGYDKNKSQAGLWEMKNCMGRIIFEPGFKQGSVFE